VHGCSQQWRSLTAASTTESPIPMTYQPEPVPEVGAITSTPDFGVPGNIFQLAPVSGIKQNIVSSLA